MKVGESTVSNGGFLNAQLDELELFNRALGPREVDNIFNAGSGGKCQPASSGNPTSTVTIQKVVDTLPFTSTTPFAISVDCGGTVTQAPLANGGLQTVTAAAGTSCTVSETLPTGTFNAPGCPAGAQWLPPTFVPSPTVVISTSAAKLLVVHNAFKCN
jgi:hypothetical protein